MKHLLHVIAQLVWPAPMTSDIPHDVIGKVHDTIQTSQSFRREVRRRIRDKDFMENVLGLKDDV